ncbi:MAG: hypothetical protein BHV99_02540 [Clostridium sp. 26_21]|nr:MAG: hypothetical protein BHV99_02540 [Clostridium sp. 26_21]
MNNSEQLVSILTIIAIILVVVIFVLIGVWIFIVAKEKKKGNKEQSEEKETAKNKVAYNINSIFDFMEFEKIEDNMIIQKKGKFLMVIECQGVNYDLMSDMERTSVEQGFIEFLNTLKSEIQIYVQTRTVNLEQSIQSYKLKFRDIQDKYNVIQNQYIQMKNAEPGEYTDQQIYNTYLEYLREKNKFEYTQDIIADTEKSSLNSNVLHKKYYIIIPYYEDEVSTQNYTKDEIQSMVFSELYTKARSMMRTLTRCEVNSKILDSQGLIELLYNAYNRDDADVFSAKQALNSGFEALYSTAPDVLDKKMKLINKKIEEEAVKVAQQAILEAKSDKEMMVRIREENAKNLIFDMAEQLITENQDYLDQDISEDAKVKVRRKKKENEEGGTKDENKKS